MAKFNLPFGIHIAGSDPIDDRVIVADQAAREALVTDGLAHEGMVVYQADSKQYFALKGSTNADWGQLIPDNIVADIEELKNPTIGATYQEPELFISLTNSASVEKGSRITETLILAFIQNDAGVEEVSSAEIFRNGQSISTGSMTAVEGYIIGDEVVEYTAQINHAQGPIKQNSKGEEEPEGQIQAGTISSSFPTYISGYQRLFYGTGKPQSGPQVRSFSDANPVQLLAGNESVFQFNLPKGEKQLYIAVPTGRSVKMAFAEVSDLDVSASFSLIGQIDVPDANDDRDFYDLYQSELAGQGYTTDMIYQFEVQ
ncbi:hypothetical protein [Persicobacter diffluens]|uniref:Uncharacterized protein n=1 Tax=Persicobacter diffluens TaxID=981 RepID=A0AAN4W516_9BACT|nr:hypothetical protein PEDI_55210 [Persicobacter diffluens]